MNTTKSDKLDITQKQFCTIFEKSIKEAADTFRDTWNRKNPQDQIDFRFKINRVQITDHPDFKAQATLTFEVKTDFRWNLLSRTTANLRTVRELHNNEAEWLLKLWSDMFSEITAIGFSSVIHYINGKENDKQPGHKGNLQAVENEGI